MSNQIKPNYKAVACRATWRVQRDDLELAMLQIASKRLLLDDVISNMKCVHFFFSCITAVCSNEKRASNSGNIRNESYPSVAYFIVYTPSDECTDNTFFSKLHNEDVEPDIKVNFISTRYPLDFKGGLHKN